FKNIVDATITHLNILPSSPYYPQSSPPPNIIAPSPLFPRRMSNTLPYRRTAELISGVDNQIRKLSQYVSRSLSSSRNKLREKPKKLPPHSIGEHTSKPPITPEKYDVEYRTSRDNTPVNIP